MEGYKKNTYTLWVVRPDVADAPPVPWHYEMMGYNTLLGSHYDKYLVDYREFSRSVDSRAFSLPEGVSNLPVTLQCSDHSSQCTRHLVSQSVAPSGLRVRIGRSLQM